LGLGIVSMVFEFLCLFVVFSNPPSNLDHLTVCRDRRCLSLSSDTRNRRANPEY
jgi:hypothetical protein